MKESRHNSGTSLFLIPIPSEISAQCGLAWKCVEQSEEETEKFLKKKELAWDGIYRVLV